jgi:hypothetical protein
MLPSRTVDSPKVAPLPAVRSALHADGDRRADAQFEATDALPVSAPGVSPAWPGHAPCHRCGWGNFYMARAEGRIGANTLRAAVA